MRIQNLYNTILIVSLIPVAAHAEMMVGGYAPSGVYGHPISQFSATAQGAATPLRQIAGNTAGSWSPANISYESVEGLLYVSDYRGGGIRVYPAFANGNIAPQRVINSPMLGQTRANVPLPSQDELMVIGSNCCIYTLPLHANGNSVAMIRSITWGGLEGSVTQLYSPMSLIWIPSSDEVAVVDHDFSPPYAMKVVFHARTAQGNATPTRVLKSAYTENAAGLAHDPIRHKLFLLTFTTSDNTIFHARINVFADSASGSDAPLYTIGGPASGLENGSQFYSYGIGLDLRLHRLMVSVGTPATPDGNRVVSFDLDATGDAVPVQVLTGASLSSGVVGVPFAVPVDPLFANGFDN